MTAYRVRLIFRGCEYQKDAEGAGHAVRSWELTRDITLPFAPYPRLRLTGIHSFTDDDRVWNDDEDEEFYDDGAGSLAEMVTWDVPNDQFLVRIIAFEIAIPWESTPESIAEQFPGWTGHLTEPLYDPPTE